MSTRYIVHKNGVEQAVLIAKTGTGYRIEIDGKTLEVDSCMLRGGAVRSLLIDGESYESATTTTRDGMDVYISGDVFHLQVSDELWARVEESARGARTGIEEIVSPMPGEVIQITVDPGDTVPPGATVAVVEAMKMQNEITCSRGGTVSEIRAKPGEVVDQGAVLVVLGSDGENDG